MRKTVSLLTVKNGKIIVVLSDTHTLFTPPGGTIESTDKSPLDALKREVLEELGARVINEREYHSFSGVSESGRPVYVFTFLADIVGNPVPLNEIKEVRWIGYTDKELETVSPVTRDIMRCMKTDGYF